MLMRLFQGTWFDVGLGACGKYNVNSDKIVAISSAIYGSGGNCEQVSAAEAMMPTETACIPQRANVFRAVDAHHQHRERQERVRIGSRRVPRLRRLRHRCVPPPARVSPPAERIANPGPST